MRPTSVVYWVLVLLGTGMLFPWNVFISAPDYFSNLYGEGIDYYIPAAYSIPNLLLLLVMVRYGRYITFRMACLPWFGVYFIALVTIPLFPLIFSNTAAFVLTFFLIFMTGVGCSFVQGGLFGMSGILGGTFSQALMVGNGVAGTAVCMLRIISILSFPSHDYRDSAFMFFYIAAVVILACIVATVYLSRNDYVNETVDKKNEDMNIPGEIESPSSNDDLLSNSEINMNDKKDGQKKGTAASAFGNMWHMAFSEFMTFFVTIAVFPGMAVAIKSTSEIGSWMPILMLTGFNVFDLTGRSLGQLQIKSREFTEKVILIAVCLRSVLIVFFILCINPKVFHWDGWPLLLIAITGITNGYCSTIAMKIAPEMVNSKAEMEVAQQIMVFFLLLGIAVGSLTGTFFHVVLDV